MSTTNESSSSKALPIFIALFILSLSLCGFLFYKYAKNKVKVQEQNEELTIAYQALDLKADSLQNELDIALAQLKLKINENLAQVHLKEDLRIQLEEKITALEAAHSRISKLIAKGNTGGNGGSKKLLEAKNEIAQLTEQNTTYIAKIEEAQQKYQIEKKRAEQLSDRSEQLIEEQESLNSAKTILEEKLATASILDIAGLNITAVRTKKEKQEPTPKASKAERLKISFSVLGSELTKQEDKTIIIRITGPSGAVLTKDTRTLTNSDELYSLEENLTYDGTEKQLVYYYDQEADYKKGTYSFEIYERDVLLDRGSFSLR